MKLFLASPIDTAVNSVDKISTSMKGVTDITLWENWADKGTQALIFLLIAVPLLKLAAMFIHRMVKSRLSPQGAVFLTRWIWRIGLALVLLTVLKQLGFDLIAVLGAAGIAGVAIGFAAQNSLSNVISGLFLMGERSINLGDYIEVSGMSGMVDAIGLLSVSLRTLDNKEVRIPNETILKGIMTNITRYPIRRLDLSVGVSYNEDLDKVMRVLRNVLLNNTACLDDPEALVSFTGFGNSSCDFLVGAWCRKEDYLALKNSLSREIKEAFDREGIEIPFPYTVLSGGKAAAPIDINIIHTRAAKNS